MCVRLKKVDVSAERGALQCQAGERYFLSLGSLTEHRCDGMSMYSWSLLVVVVKSHGLQRQVNCVWGVCLSPRPVIAIDTLWSLVVKFPLRCLDGKAVCMHL